MKVFLAGASGVVGRRLIPVLVAAGHQVTGMTRSPAKAGAIAAAFAALEPSLQSEHQAKAVLDFRQETTGKAARPLEKASLVDRRYLRDVDDRWFGQAGFTVATVHVPWSPGKAHVGGDGCDDHGLNGASVELVDLEDDDRTTIARLGAFGSPESGPPDLTAVHYHSSCSASA